MANTRCLFIKKMLLKCRPALFALILFCCCLGSIDCAGRHGKHSKVVKHAVLAAEQSSAPLPLPPQDPEAVVSTSKNPPPEEKEVKASAGTTVAVVQEKVHSVVHKVLRIINTHINKHDKHRKEAHKPVCTLPPTGLRFCSGLSHAAYRKNEDVSFDVLDYNAHKIFVSHADHIVYTLDQIPRVDQCKDNFKYFLCAREFPHCCDIRVCGAYGPALTVAGAEYGHRDENTGVLVKNAKKMEAADGKKTANGKEATIATFLANGTFQIHQDANTDNSTVLVKLHHRPCVGYNLTYTPLFDCMSGCARHLTMECQAMLHTSCEDLCAGQAHPTCATKQLLAVAHGQDFPNSAVSIGCCSRDVLLLSIFVTLVLFLLLAVGV